MLLLANAYNILLHRQFRLLQESKKKKESFVNVRGKGV